MEKRIERRVEKIFVFVLVVAVVVGMIIGTIKLVRLCCTQEPTIVGKAYFDSNHNCALDQGDILADGMIVSLKKAEREGDTFTFPTTTIEETVVKNGEYRFSAVLEKEEEYVIVALIQYSGIYQLPYGYDIAHYIGNNLFKTQKEEVIIGPTILLIKGGMG